MRAAAVVMGLVVFTGGAFSGQTGIPGAVARAPRQLSPLECPVVGDRMTKSYRIPTSRGYHERLKPPASGTDPRHCFFSRPSAEQAGYSFSAD